MLPFSLRQRLCIAHLIAQCGSNTSLKLNSVSNSMILEIVKEGKYNFMHFTPILRETDVQIRKGILCC
jgi:hypothetical protein